MISGRLRYHGDWIEKYYDWNSLLSTHFEQKRRWQLIENLSVSIPAFPETTLSTDATEVQVRQRRIRGTKLDAVAMTVRSHLLAGLAADLDVMSDTGFVHGDINRKNLLFDGERLRLVDLEPDLFQTRNGRRALMVTMPYVAVSDLRSGMVTAATDKLGFACLCRIWGREEPRPSRPTELVKKRRNENLPLMQGMPDADVVDLKFGVIAQVWADIDRN